jgi:hypothetical protein
VEQFEADLAAAAIGPSLDRSKDDVETIKLVFNVTHPSNKSCAQPKTIQ